MIKYISVFCVVLLIWNAGLMAQGISRDEQLRVTLGMDSSHYTDFYKGLQPYNKRLGTAFRDSALGKSDKNLLIKQILGERRSYTQQHLTPDQLKRLQEFESKRPGEGPSPYQKEMDAMQESLKKKGAKKVTSSIPLTPVQPGRQ